MSDSFEIVNVNQNILVEQSITEVTVAQTVELTQVLTEVAKTVINTLSDVTSIVHEATVVNFGGSSTNSYFPAGW